MWSRRAEQIVTELIAATTPEQRARTHSDRLGALQIGWSLWAEYYLRPNGEVVIVGADEDRPDEVTVRTGRTDLLTVLVSGSKRYPALRELLPVRPPGAVDCRCRQVPIFAEGRVLCSICGALGWLPPEPTPEHPPRPDRRLIEPSPSPSSEEAGGKEPSEEVCRMTEAEWLASNDPAEMYDQVVRPMNCSRRRLDLFCVACVRLVWHLLDHPELRLPFEWLEMHPGERVLPRGGMSDLFQGPAKVLHDWRYRHDLGLNTFAIHIAHDLWADLFVYAFDNLGKESTYDLSVLREDPCVFLPAVMREIFGNPFQSTAYCFSLKWRTDSTVAIARGAYESRDFEVMPVLADALEEAGCDDKCILDHCRLPGTHVRGCWVVDLLLGEA